METQPTGPAVPVHVPTRGTSQCLFYNLAPTRSDDIFLDQCEDFIYSFLVLPWPVWTSALERLTAFVNVVTVAPDVRGLYSGQSVLYNQPHISLTCQRYDH